MVARAARSLSAPTRQSSVQFSDSSFYVVMPYALTRVYVCIVLAVMSVLAVMAAVVFALGGQRVGEVGRPKGLPAGMTVPAERRLFAEERVERSPAVDDALYDVEDFARDREMVRLTKHNAKYYSIAYRTNDDDEDRFPEDDGGGGIAPLDGDD